MKVSLDEGGEGEEEGVANELEEVVKTLLLDRIGLTELLRLVEDERKLRDKLRQVKARNIFKKKIEARGEREEVKRRGQGGQIRNRPSQRP